MLSAETEGLGQNSVYHFLSWKCGVKREVLQLNQFSQSLLQAYSLYDLDPSHSLPARAADTPVILTNSPICAAIPSLPHTRLILPPIERKILLRHNAMSIGQHNTKLLLWDLSSLIWRVPAKMFLDCAHMMGFLTQAHEQEQCSIFHEMLFR